jgi:LysM repeat protein
MPVHAKTPVGIQNKLTIGAAGDAFEQEADRVAERVMRMPEPPARSQAQTGLSEHPVAPAKQVQTKSSHTGNSGGIAAPPIVHDVLRSPGQPLDAATRAFMEPRFGHDFSKVRVHADGRAAESSRAIMARAYTVGADIVFGNGQFAPATSEGRSLLAHELTHAVQQNFSANLQVSRQEDYETITVKKGQTLYGIAKEYGTTVAVLQALNNLKSSDVKEGQTLKVPKKPARPVGAGSGKTGQAPVHKIRHRNKRSTRKMWHRNKRSTPVRLIQRPMPVRLTQRPAPPSAGIRRETGDCS